MNIQIHSIGFDADKKLLDFIHQKIDKLVKFSDEIISAEVFLRLENVQNNENKIAEIKLEIPGNDLFAKKQSNRFEDATNHVIDALISQLKKRKEKARGI